MGIQLFCWGAQITVKLQPLGALLELAASLQKAADDIERIEEAVNWWDRNEEVPEIMAFRSRTRYSTGRTSLLRSRGNWWLGSLSLIFIESSRGIKGRVSGERVR